jgi:DNA transposition AAA+ family ATPase
MSDETTTLPEATGQTPSDTAFTGDQFAIPQNMILDGIHMYSAQDQEDLLWLSGYIRTDLRGSVKRACQLLECHSTTLSRVFRGKYGAEITSFMESVRVLRKTPGVVSSGFVETPVTRKIFALLDMARKYNSCVLIEGPTGRSKTEAVREWQRRNNHGRSVYIDCPVIGGAGALLKEIARRTGINTQRSGADIADRLEHSFDVRHTLIFDEVARLIPRGSGSKDTKPLEFIRRLHDVCGCGVVFVATHIFSDECRRGSMAAYLEQLMGRVEDIMRIPEKVSRAEALAICQAFNKTPEPGLVEYAQNLANVEGQGRVRVLFTLIRQASELAQKRGEPLAMKHLKAAKAYRDNLNREWED